MTLLSEAVRILGKDLRVLRWPLATWCTFLALSVLRGLDVLPALHEVMYPVTIFVPIMAATLVAYAVTLDPAVAGPTFWGVHRQRPVAVAIAKATLALLLLGAMMLGQAMVLASHGLSGVQVLSLVATAARTTAPWMLCAAALAACARDARGWLVGAVLVGVMAMLITMVATDRSGALARWPVTYKSGSLLITAVSVIVLTWAYRAQLTGIRAAMRNAALMVIAAVVLVAPRNSGAEPLDDAPHRPDTSTIVHNDRIVARIAQRAVVVDVPVSYPDSSVFSGVTTSWRLQLRDGSAIDLLPGGARVRRGPMPLKPEENIALWGRGTVTRTLEFRFPLDSATLARVDGNVSAVTLALRTDRVTMERVASFPAAQGGTLAFEGARLRIAPATADGRFAYRVSHVGLPAGISHMPWSAAYIARPIVALQSDDDRDVRVLKPVDADTRASMLSGSWVLPGNEMGGQVYALVPAGSTRHMTGNVIALAGEYAGRIEQAIRAPVAR